MNFSGTFSSQAWSWWSNWRLSLFDPQGRTKTSQGNTCLTSLANTKMIFDVEMLVAQLKIMQNIFHTPAKNVKDFASEFCNLPSTTWRMLNQVECLVILTVPTTSPSVERSLSALRRIKTYLRATMLQKWLTHLLLLHIHKLEPWQISVEEVLGKCIRKTAEAQNIWN